MHVHVSGVVVHVMHVHVSGVQCTVRVTLWYMCTITGQFIRIWGRIPFTPGPQPPPLQQSEPYWQQMFNHQHQVHVVHTCNVAH